MAVQRMLTNDNTKEKSFDDENKQMRYKLEKIFGFFNYSVIAEIIINL